MISRSVSVTSVSVTPKTLFRSRNPFETRSSTRFFLIFEQYGHFHELQRALMILPSDFRKVPMGVGHFFRFTVWGCSWEFRGGVRGALPLPSLVRFRTFTISLSEDIFCGIGLHLFTQVPVAVAFRTWLNVETAVADVFDTDLFFRPLGIFFDPFYKSVKINWWLTFEKFRISHFRDNKKIALSPGAADMTFRFSGDRHIFNILKNSRLHPGQCTLFFAISCDSIARFLPCRTESSRTFRACTCTVSYLYLRHCGFFFRDEQGKFPVRIRALLKRRQDSC